MTTLPTPLLFTPLTIRSLTLPNRLWVSPMCMYSAVDGVPQDWHRTHLAQFASGGAGLIVAEATGVVPEGRISPRDTGIWNDEQRDAWALVVDDVHERGGLIGIQLAHAGRMASTWWPWADQHGTVPVADGGWPTVAPSAIAFDGYAPPAALDATGIDRIVDAFADAAGRALDAGFDALEVHGAHGYLLHEFLSPLSNVRDDEYGGPLENRARLLLRIVERVRTVAGAATPVFVRLSATDYAEGGFTPEQAAQVAVWAMDAGADLVDVSSGGIVARPRIDYRPGFQVPFAETVRAGGRVPTAAVGLITSGEQAERVLASGAADAIFAGREWLRDPHFGLRAAHELGAEVPWPPQYRRAHWR